MAKPPALEAATNMDRLLRRAVGAVHASALTAAVDLILKDLATGVLDSGIRGDTLVGLRPVDNNGRLQQASSIPCAKTLFISYHRLVLPSPYFDTTHTTGSNTDRCEYANCN
jgi:hypothetical protein